MEILLISPIDRQLKRTCLLQIEVSIVQSCPLISRILGMIICQLLIEPALGLIKTTNQIFKLLHLKFPQMMKQVYQIKRQDRIGCKRRVVKDRACITTSSTLKTPVSKALNPICQDQHNQVSNTKLMEKFLYAGFASELKKREQLHQKANQISSSAHVSVLDQWV